jgi:predicted metal-dependent hydrolase
MSASGVQVLIGQDNAEQRNMSALQLRDRNAFNFGSVLFKDCNELLVARISFANALSVRKGNIRYAALLRFTAVFHKEVHAIADNDSHRIDPEISNLTDGGLPGPAQVSAA